MTQIRKLAGVGPIRKTEEIKSQERRLARKKALEKYLADSIPEMRLKDEPLIIDRYTIAKMLPEGSVLIDFVQTSIFDFYASSQSPWKPPHYLSFIVFSGDPDHVHMIDLGEVRYIDEIVLSVKKSIIDRKQDDIYARSKRLREVLAPIFKILGDSRELFICPDGELIGIPFEMLSIDTKRFLIDDYKICYLSASRAGLD